MHSKNNPENLFHTFVILFSIETRGAASFFTGILAPLCATLLSYRVNVNLLFVKVQDLLKIGLGSSKERAESMILSRRI